MNIHAKQHRVLNPSKIRLAIGLLALAMVAVLLTACQKNTAAPPVPDTRGEPADGGRPLPDVQHTNDVEPIIPPSGDPFISEHYLPLNKGTSQILTPEEPFLVIDIGWDGPSSEPEVILEARFLQNGKWTGWLPAPGPFEIRGAYQTFFQLKQPATKAEFRTPEWYTKPLTAKIDFNRFLCAVNCGD